MKYLTQFLIPAIIAASVTLLFNNSKISSSDIEMKIWKSKYELSGEITDLDSKIRKIEWDIMGLTHDRVVFNLADPGGFRRIDTDLGSPLFLSVDHVEKYMDGYKIKLRIGNPNNVTIHDLSIKIEWWLESYFKDYAKYNKEETESERLKESKSKTQRLLSPIQPGKWNYVDIIIPSISEQDAKSVRIMIEDAPVVSLS